MYIYLPKISATKVVKVLKRATFIFIYNYSIEKFYWINYLFWVYRIYFFFFLYYYYFYVIISFFYKEVNNNN